MSKDRIPKDPKESGSDNGAVGKPATQVAPGQPTVRPIEIEEVKYLRLQVALLTERLVMKDQELLKLQMQILETKRQGVRTSAEELINSVPALDGLGMEQLVGVTQTKDGKFSALISDVPAGPRLAK